MKRELIHILLLLAGLTMLFSCEKQTTPDPVRIQYPDQQSPILRDDAYYARLRAYKKTDHKLAFGWYGSWTGIGASRQSRLQSAPDSMDIISIWSQWHSLSPEQIADKAFVQQIKGTKVVFCISAKDMPEEFKVNGQITEAGIEAYAKAWGKDSMDKYQYDGMDIDFETAVDHQGPMNKNPENFKKFAEELSKYIGPKSGTGRLFLIDGNVDSDWLPENIGELCDYAVSQAYNCTSAGNLRTRTANAGGRGWRPEQMIFTENFESLWQTGGADYSYDGETIPSLLGMAYFALEETSAGFGAYHMEYEYGNSSMPYKYMRQAIQIANPAPMGDYSKNLLSIDQAGEMEIGLARFPSGSGESAIVPLSGSLSALAASDLSIPLVLDAGLVEAYNEYNYTEYVPVDPSAISFSGPFAFAAGSQHTSEEHSVLMTVKGAKLESGKEYLAVVRADYSGIDGVSVNTEKEILYVRIRVDADPVANTVAISGRTEETLTVIQAIDNTLISAGTCELSASLRYGAAEDVVFAFESDASLVEAYNQSHGTSYAALGLDRLTLPGQLVIGEGGKQTETVTIGVREPETLEDGNYLVAFRIELRASSDYTVPVEKSLIRYIFVTKVKTNINEGATGVDGTPIEDRSGWTYRADGVDCSADLFDGVLYPGGWWFTTDDPVVKDAVQVEVDMASVRTIVGWKMGYYDHATPALRDIAVSVDGKEWVSQASGQISLAIVGQWQYVELLTPVECRYIRMTYLRLNNYRFGSSEFQAIAPKN